MVMAHIPFGTVLCMTAIGSVDDTMALDGASGRMEECMMENGSMAWLMGRARKQDRMEV